MAAKPRVGVRNVRWRPFAIAAPSRESRRAHPLNQRQCQIAAGAVAADGDVVGRNPLTAQEAPRRHSVLMRRGKRMLGRAAVVDRQRPHPRGAARFRHQSAWLIIEPEQ